MSATDTVESLKGAEGLQDGAQGALSLEELRASVHRLQALAERVASRVSAGSIAEIGQAWGYPRQRSARMLRRLERWRAGIMSSVQERATRLAETLLGYLPLASREEVAELRQRLAELEHRLVRRRARQRVRRDTIGATPEDR